jgi:hypothetical protein
MKKLLLILFVLLGIFLYSCRTVPQCPAYGETHRYQGQYKIHYKIHDQSCPAYGEHKKFQKSQSKREKEKCPTFY